MYNFSLLKKLIYCGSIFVGNCRAKIFHHFDSFGQQIKWEPLMLLQVRNNGPVMNLKFDNVVSQ